MPCCKSEEYHWCKDLPVVDYKDEEGREYCVFHAPVGKKGISAKEFNELIFERINLAKNTNQPCNLSGTIFEWDIRFYKYNKDDPLPPVDFSDATFNGEVAFWDATFNEWADFGQATFNGEAYFREALFNVELNFKNVRIKGKILFEGSGLKKVFFLGTDLRKIDFINCTWPKKIGRDVLSAEIILFGDETKQRFKGGLVQILKQEWDGFKKDISCNKEAIKKVEILYRMLKQKYKEEHNEYEVSNWHYGEKEMFRKGSYFRRFFPLSLSNLYWLSSGYGERPVRAGIVLISLIFILSILSGMEGLKPPEGGFAAIILNTLQYATLQKVTLPEPTSLTGGYLKLLTQILIPLQTALFALAIKNRFKR